MYSDGVTMLNGNNANVIGNLFVDNTDINFIMGTGNKAVVQQNSVVMESGYAFGGFMLDNFDGSTPGDYQFLVMSSNNIQCSFLCDFGIQVGPRPWYNPIDNIYGGLITNNEINAAGILIDVDGGGVPSIPITIYHNGLLNPATVWHFACGNRPGALLNIAPGSFVNRNGDTFPITNNAMNGCY